jgi:hypothetical protein
MTRLESYLVRRGEAPVVVDTVAWSYDAPRVIPWCGHMTRLESYRGVVI